MRFRRWWLAGLALVAVAGCAAGAIIAARQAPGMRRLGAETRAARLWVGAVVDNPLPRVGPLRGAALVGGMMGGAAAAVWADHAGEAHTVADLDAALRAAKPVLITAPTGCSPMITMGLALLPTDGIRVYVNSVWLCGPTVRDDSGFSRSTSRSSQFVEISVGNRDLGVFRAPALAAP